MKFFDEEMLKNLSVEDMERLRREMRNLNRLLHEELGRRARYCAHCGDRLGISDHGFRYCSAWHRYLDGHKNTATLSRSEFERKRALSRIRTIKKEVGTKAIPSKNSDLDGATEFSVSLRNLKIRRVLSEYQTITGESLNTSVRANRRSKAPDQ